MRPTKLTAVFGDALSHSIGDDKLTPPRLFLVGFAHFSNLKRLNINVSFKDKDFHQFRKIAMS